jgi:hypothetical protein
MSTSMKAPVWDDIIYRTRAAGEPLVGWEGCVKHCTADELRAYISDRGVDPKWLVLCRDELMKRVLQAFEVTP